MVTCCIKSCKNRSDPKHTPPDISLHRLPTDEVIKDKWIHLIRIARNEEDWLPTKFTGICSVHFNESDTYLSNKGRRLLKKGALPKQLNLPNNEQSTMDLGLTYGPTTSYSFVELPAENSEKEEEIRDSDIESIFDSPMEHKLRQQSRRYLARSKKLANQVRSLKKQVNRLKKRNSSLKSIIKEFKQKTPQSNIDQHEDESDE